MPSRAALAGALMVTSNREGAAQIADIVVAWNVFAHFYPYLDIISTDWQAYLDEALASAIAGDANVLDRLVVAAEDGHGDVISNQRHAPLPLYLERVEDKIVVIASNDAAVKPGDEIVSIDGVAATAAFDAEYALHSGSSQWRPYVTSIVLGKGPEGSAAALDVRRGGVASSVLWGQLGCPIW